MCGQYLYDRCDLTTLSFHIEIGSVPQHDTITDDLIGELKVEYLNPRGLCLSCSTRLFKMISTIQQNVGWRETLKFEFKIAEYDATKKQQRCP